jgi:hypothetical protein
VNGAGRQLLAGAGLAFDQQRDVFTRDAAELGKDDAHRL